MALLTRPRRVGASEFTRNYYDQGKRIGKPTVLSLDQEELPRAPAVFPLLPKDVGGNWSSPPSVNPCIWRSSHQTKLQEAQSATSASQRQREENQRIRQDVQYVTTLHEDNVSRRLDDRRCDVTFWQEELDRRHVELYEDCESLKSLRDRLEKQHEVFLYPLNVAQTCVGIRNERVGIELVEDEASLALRQEIQELTRSRSVLAQIYKDCRIQIRETLSSLYHLEKDIDKKRFALRVDSKTHQLTPLEEPSRIISKQELDPSPMAVSDWKNNCMELVNRAEKKHDRAVQLISLSESLLTSSFRQVKAAVTQTDECLKRRIEDSRNAKMILEQEHSELVKEEGLLEASISDLKCELEAKREPLSICQTRLDIRKYRPATEQTRDEVEGALLKEVKELEMSISRLLTGILHSEERQEILGSTKRSLEHDINLKIKTLHLDEAKVMKLRSTVLIDQC